MKCPSDKISHLQRGLLLISLIQSNERRDVGERGFLPSMPCVCSISRSINGLNADSGDRSPAVQTGNTGKHQGANKHDYNTLGYSIYTNKPLRPSPTVKSTDLIFALRGEISRNTVQLTILCTTKVMPHK